MFGKIFVFVLLSATCIHALSKPVQYGLKTTKEALSSTTEQQPWSTTSKDKGDVSSSTTEQSSSTTSEDNTSSTTEKNSSNITTGDVSSSTTKQSSSTTSEDNTSSTTEKNSSNITTETESSSSSSTDSSSSTVDYSFTEESLGTTESTEKIPSSTTPKINKNEQVFLNNNEKVEKWYSASILKIEQAYENLVAQANAEYFNSGLDSAKYEKSVLAANKFREQKLKQLNLKFIKLRNDIIAARNPVPKNE